MGVECPYLRPKSLSNDKSNVHEAMLNIMKYYKKKFSNRCCCFITAYITFKRGV